MNTVIYCRVSTKEQVNEGMSLQNQEKACLEYAEKHDYVVAEKFIELGESAKTTDRTQLLSLLEFCSQNKGKVDSIIVWKIDRFARNTEQYFALRAVLAKYGVRVISVTELIDDSPSGKLMETMLAGFAQFDNDVRTVRVNIGMNQSVKEGRWVFGRTPMGYLRSKGADGKPLLIKDETKAPTILKAYTEYSTGLYTQAEILKVVNSLGLKTNEGKPISKQTLHKMLQNPLYMGYLRNSWENKLEKGTHEAIVTEELWNACQAVQKGLKPSMVPRAKNNPEFPLRGLLKCEKCGKNLTASMSTGKTKKYGYYRCYECKGINLGSASIHESFLVLLNSIKPTAKNAKIFKDMCTDVWKEQYQGTEQVKASLNSDLMALEDKKNKLVDLRLSNKFDEEEFDNQMARVKNQIAVLEIELSEIKVESYDIETMLNYAEWLLVRTDKVWNDLELNQKQKFQHFIFPEGLTINEKGIIGTPVLSPLYAIFSIPVDEKSTLVVPRRVEPLFVHGRSPLTDKRFLGKWTTYDSAKRKP